ncbi:30S ribosomal protein S17 [Buchnera aphidicola (Hormaphis cornu)]|nr:30S ribosomal protein S17 [Buchnera aphidicola (Hormaphis cornu)]
MISKNRILRGRVSSNKMHKSAVVLIERLFKHPLYGKFIRKTTKLHIHDEFNKCKVGDTVEISECKPISKTKSWLLVRILK